MLSWLNGTDKKNTMELYNRKGSFSLWMITRQINLVQNIILRRLILSQMIRSVPRYMPLGQLKTDPQWHTQMLTRFSYIKSSTAHRPSNKYRLFITPYYSTKWRNTVIRKPMDEFIEFFIYFFTKAPFYNYISQSGHFRAIERSQYLPTLCNSLIPDKFVWYM